MKVKQFFLTLILSIVFAAQSHATPSCNKKLKPTDVIAELKADIKYRQKKMSELEEAIKSKSIFTLEDDSDQTVSWALSRSKSGEINSKTYGYGVKYRKLEIDFATNKAIVTFRPGNGARKDIALVLEKSNAKQVAAGTRLHLSLQLETSIGETESLNHMSSNELKQVIANAKKTEIKKAKEISPDAVFYHITKDQNSMKAILKNGMEPGTGFMGDGVYGVLPENLKELKKWMRNADWTESTRLQVVAIKVKPDAVVLDIASEEGSRAFDAFKLLLTPEQKRLSQVDIINLFIKTMDADIVFYPWQTNLPAIAIKNPSVIRAIQRHR